jgi:hypothetical protein
VNPDTTRDDERGGMAETEDKRRKTITAAIGIGQILSMIVGFGGVIYSLGVKGEQLERARADMHALSNTVTDLASAQASAAVADAKDKSAVEDIKRRLDSIERRMEQLHGR